MATKTKIEPDLREFYALSNPKKKPCKVGIALSQMRDQDLVNLQAALADEHGLITTSAIASVINKKISGLGCSPSAVTSHKRRTCSCATKDRT